MIKDKKEPYMKLTESKILITGGSLGIGKAMAKLFVEEGAKVIITGRDKNRLNSAAKETGAIPKIFDVSDFDQIVPKTCEIIEELGGIDILINNAGIGEFDLLDDITLESFQRIFNINVFGLALLTKEVSKRFKKQNRGQIINLGSTAASKGFEYGTVYAASKFALRGMTQCWQAELRKFNVRVTLLNPSEVTTAFSDNATRMERENESKKLAPQDIAFMAKTIIEMENKGFIPEITAWATNPW